MEVEFQKLNVYSRETFIRFIEKLMEDFQANKDNWENKNLADFLEALARYTEDVQGFYDNTNQNINADEPSWRVFADIIKGATIYE